MGVLYGVESIKIGPAGANGTMGASLTRITPIAEGSVSFTIPARAKTEIRAEDVTGSVASISTDGDATTFIFDSLDLDNATCLLLFGGSITGNIYSYPTNPESQELSIELTTKLIGGKRSIFRIPLTSADASFEGSFTKADVSRIRLTASVLTAIDAEGDPVAPWTKEEVAA